MSSDLSDFRYFYDKEEDKPIKLAYEDIKIDAGPRSHDVGSRLMRLEERSRSTPEEGAGTLLLPDSKHQDGGTGAGDKVRCRH